MNNKVMCRERLWGLGVHLPFVALEIPLATYVVPVIRKMIGDCKAESWPVVREGGGEPGFLRPINDLANVHY